MAEEVDLREGEDPTYRLEKWRPVYWEGSDAVAIQLIATEIAPDKAYPEVRLNFVFFDLQEGGQLFDSIAQELYLRAAQQADEDSV